MSGLSFKIIFGDILDPVSSGLGKNVWNTAIELIKHVCRACLCDHVDFKRKCTWKCWKPFYHENHCTRSNKIVSTCNQWSLSYLLKHGKWYGEYIECCWMYYKASLCLFAENVNPFYHQSHPFKHTVLQIFNCIRIKLLYMRLWTTFNISFETFNFSGCLEVSFLDLMRRTSFLRPSNIFDLSIKYTAAKPPI